MKSQQQHVSTSSLTSHPLYHPLPPSLLSLPPLSLTPLPPCLRLSQSSFKDVGKQLEQSQLEALTAQLQLFQSHLSSFALHHRSAINANPILRYQFHSMCTSIGVDPLSTQRSLLSSVLHLGDFYYTLALHLAETCILTQPSNGGLISLPELLTRLRRKVPGSPRLSVQDVLTALSKLECLGGGWGGGGGGGRGGDGEVGGE